MTSELLDRSAVQPPEPPEGEIGHGLGDADTDLMLSEATLDERPSDELQRVVFERCEGVGAKWPGVRMRDAVLRGGDLSNADFSDATLRRVQAEGVKAVGWNLTQATLEDAIVTTSKLSMSFWLGASLTRIWFEGCDLREAEFEECRLDGVVFRDCDLRGPACSAPTSPASTSAARASTASPSRRAARRGP